MYAIVEYRFGRVEQYIGPFSDFATMLDLVADLSITCDPKVTEYGWVKLNSPDNY